MEPAGHKSNEARLVDVSKMDSETATSAIQGDRVRIRGVPIGHNRKNGSLELSVVDGKVYVLLVDLPNTVKKHIEDGHNVTCEIEGEILKSKPSDKVMLGKCYVSDQRRLIWEVTNSNGHIVERGEFKENAITQRIEERLLPVEPKAN